jgi:amino acid adenylation domain-containing protein
MLDAQVTEAVSSASEAQAASGATSAEWAPVALRTDFRPGNARRRAAYQSSLAPETVANIQSTAGGSDARTLAIAATVTALYSSRHSETEQLLLAVTSGNLGPLPVRFEFRQGESFGDLLRRHEARIMHPAPDAAGDNSPACRMLVRLDGGATPSTDAAFDCVTRFALDGPAPSIRTEYEATLYRPETIELFHAALEAILTEGLGNPAMAADGLGGLTDEQRQMIREVNATECPIPDDRTLVPCIAERNAPVADRIALICGEAGSFSWQSLATAASAIAAELRQAGVARGDIVGLMTRRSVAAVAGVLGILQAGAAYLPLDSGYPAERLHYLVDNARAKAVLTDVQRVSLPVPMIELSTQLLSFKTAVEPTIADGSDLAYLIYTSGSTGQPKGVMLDHQGRLNNFTDFNQRFEIGAGDSLLAVSALNFDMSAYDILGSLLAGSRIVMVEDRALSQPTEWLALMRRHRVSIWHSVPSLLCALLDSIETLPPGSDVPNDLRLVLLGGDWIPVGLTDRVHSIWPQAKVISLGGATELSMDSLIYQIEHADPAWKSVPYGRPMVNQTAYVLDQRGALAPLGIAGQLFLGGHGVAWGYAGRPALTANKFVPDPYANHPGGRLYATGDWARLMPDGELELLGRMDFQIKLRGLRIDLGEIEGVLRGQSFVRDAVVMVNETETGMQQLGAWLVLSTDSADNEEVFRLLRRSLARRLPAYMVPTLFVALDRLPLLANGKLDRGSLRRWNGAAVRPQAATPADRFEDLVRYFFAEALGREAVGREDNFFDLGGYSLLAFRLIGNLEEALATQVPLRLVFEAPTPAEFTSALRDELTANSVNLQPILAAWETIPAHGAAL